MRDAMVIFDLFAMLQGNFLGFGKCVSILSAEVVVTSNLALNHDCFIILSSNVQSFANSPIVEQ